MTEAELHSSQSPESQDPSASDIPPNLDEATQKRLAERAEQHAQEMRAVEHEKFKQARSRALVAFKAQPREGQIETLFGRLYDLSIQFQMFTKLVSEDMVKTAEVVNAHSEQINVIVGAHRQLRGLVESALSRDENAPPSDPAKEEQLELQDVVPHNIPE